jgi:hypothetical protein
MCTRIEVYIKADKKRPVRTYKFAYLDPGKDDERLQPKVGGQGREQTAKSVSEKMEV